MPPISLKLVLELASAALLVALGAFLAVWLYANPRIEALHAQIAQIQADDAKATAKFLADAADKEKEYQDAKDAAAAQFAAAQAESQKRAAALSSDGKRLRDTIAAYSAVVNSPMPNNTGQVACADGRTEVLGRLLSESASLLVEGAAIAKSSADQIRALQASP